MRFGFVLKRAKPEARATATTLVELLKKRGIDVVVPADEGGGPPPPGCTVVPREALGSAIDVLVVMGGDGTFLEGASLVADHGVPLLGINLGTLGFMTQYTLEEAQAAVTAAADGTLQVEERMRLQVTVVEGGREIETRPAVNDAVITQRSIARLIDLEASTDGYPITLYKADGLILSTPTGSTAYNLAAGGPILAPRLEVLVLTPICPHTLTNRPVVLSPLSRVSVTNSSPYQVTLTVDGQWTRELAPGAGILVTKAEQPLRLFKPPGTFFSTLQRKLRWGERQA